MRVEADLERAGVGVDAAARARLAKLTDGAHQFEAMMLGEMLKGLKFGQSPEDAGEGGEAAGASGTIAGYGTEALARAISQGGGFGLARQIVEQVTAEDKTKGGVGGGSDSTGGASAGARKESKV